MRLSFIVQFFSISLGIFYCLVIFSIALLQGLIRISGSAMKLRVFSLLAISALLSRRRRDPVYPFPIKDLVFCIDFIQRKLGFAQGNSVF